MIRSWFRTPARKSLPGQPLPSSAKAGKPARARLRLEPFEDRTATSTVPVGPLPDWEPPALVGDAPTPALVGDAPTPDPAPDSTADTPPEAALPGVVGGDTPFSKSQTLADSPPAVRAPMTGARFGPEADVAEEPAQQPVRVAKSEKADTTATQSEAKPAPSTPAAPDLYAGRSSRPADRQASAATPAAAVTTAPAVGVAQAVRAGKSNGPAMRLRADAADLAGPPTNGSGRTANRTDLAARTSTEQFPADIPDGSLLQRFVADREQAAFAALVQRHGGFVLGVCHRVLGDFHAAQDAVQATFLVLARKAGMLDRSGPLGGWLYKVAYHLALRSRAVAARQRLTERTADPGEPADLPAPDLDEEEVRQALREELQHLPEKYRAPLMLCYFDGRTHADAAREIGVPRGSMAKRIGEGLECLRERLLDRGVTF